MLHRIEWNARRATSLDGLRGWIRPALLLSLAAILSRIQWAAGVAPFAQALLAAGMCADVCPAALLVGSFAGAWNGGWQLAAPLGAVAIWCAFYGTRMLRRSWFEGEGGIAALTALTLLASGLPFAAGDAMRCATVLISAAAAAIAAPFFAAALRLSPSRCHLMPEERAGVLMLLLTTLAGMNLLWRPLGVFCAAMAVMLSTSLGMGTAACVGLASGMALAMTGGGLADGAIFGAMGLVCGICPSEKRWVSALMASLAAASCVFLQNWAILDGAAALSGVAVSMLLPIKWTEKFGAAVAEERNACDPDRLAEMLRRESAERLDAMSAAFGEMAERCREPVTSPDEQTLICEMRERLCDGCTRYADCWAGDSNRAVRFLCQLISQAVEWSGGDCAEPLFGDEMPPNVLRICARGKAIPSRLGVMLEDFAQDRRQAQRRGSANQRVAAQFLQAQTLLSGLARAQSQPIRVRGRMAARARSALDRAGIDADVMALRGKRMELVATRTRGRWSAESARAAARQLTRAFGRAYAVESVADGVEARFVRVPKFDAECAAESVPRVEGAVCGDCCVAQRLEGDRLVLAMSDGMGSGEEAARESRQTLRLLMRFLAADVPRRAAIRAVNELMLAREEMDMFATVDLCVIDLATGVAEFSKLAAGRSLIWREGEAIVVEGGRLPLGILSDVQAATRRVELRRGDVVVMASDGVMDVLGNEEIGMCVGNDVEEMARRIVEKAEEKMGRRDDMTCLCALVGGAGASPRR